MNYMKEVDNRTPEKNIPHRFFRKISQRKHGFRRDPEGMPEKLVRG